MQDYHHKLQGYSDSLEGCDPESAEFIKTMKEILEHKDALLAVASDEWDAADRLAFTILGKDNCYVQYLNQNPTNPRLEFAFALLDRNRAANLPSQRLEKMVELISECNTPECQLVVLQEIWHMLPKQSDGIDFNVLLPTILRIIGVILHRYLNVKKDKASSDKDKLENQIRLEQNCEVWVKDILIKLTTTISQIIAGKQQARRLYLRYCCDLVEALLRNKLDGTLLPEILDEVLKATVKEVLPRYSLSELVDIHSQILRITVAYQQEEKDLEVPERYNPTSSINSAGWTYLVNVYLEQPACLQFYSQVFLRRTLILAVSESILKPYPHKLRLLELFAKKLGKGSVLRPRSNLEFEYPVSTLYGRLLNYDSSQTQHTSTTKAILAALQITPEIAKKVLESNRNANTTQNIVERVCRSGQVGSWTVFLKSLIEKQDFPINSQTQELISKTLGVPQPSTSSTGGA